MTKKGWWKFWTFTNRVWSMKEKGFTLTEVLITIATIGVVSALTIPVLMRDNDEQQAAVLYKKTVQILNEVGEICSTMDGFDYTDVSSSTGPNANALYNNDVLTQSVWGMVASKAQVDVGQSVSGGVGGSCSGLNQIFFANGTVLCYGNTTPNGTKATVINAFIDTNGTRGPNSISSCDNTTCTGDKHINDQFRVSLTGTNAFPGHVTVGNDGITTGTDNADNAAVWAMKK